MTTHFKNKKTLFFVVINIISIVLAPLPADAVLNLSIMPVDGSNSIRFGNINSPSLVNAEVRVRVTSSDNKQYQIFQRLQESLVNDRGEQLNGDAILTSAFIGSNASGTLYVNNAERLGYSDQLIYTSNPTGLSDAFTLVYQVDKEEVKKSGSFFGKVLYTLRPVGAGTQEEVVLNVFLESYSDDFEIKVKGSRGGNHIELNSASDFKSENIIEFKFSGYSGNKLRIYQELDQFPTNEDGRLLNQDSLQFFIRGAENGDTDYLQAGSLKSRRVLLYEGAARKDIVLLHYKLNDKIIKGQMAGNFKGAVNFIVETDMANEVYPYTLEVEIAPVFELGAEYPQGGVSFKDLLPDSPAQKRDVIVTVNTNLGKPYEVIQDVSSPMTNEDGEIIQENAFTLKSELLPGEEGRIQVDGYEPVKDGNTTLFISDKKGSPAKFQVEYRLKPYRQMPAGNYKTAVIFSLNEI